MALAWAASRSPNPIAGMSFLPRSPARASRPQWSAN
jgi:hypothetical protein